MFFLVLFLLLVHASGFKQCRCAPYFLRREVNEPIQPNAIVNSYFVRARSSVAPSVVKDSFSLVNFELNIKNIGDLVKDDKIFTLHSYGAAFFGLTLLLFPDVVLQNGPITSFAYQQWSIFILAVAYITSKASTLDSGAKTLLSNAYFAMCSAEAVLYLSEIAKNFGRTSINIFFIDASSLAVFALLALGYYRSGNTSWTADSR